jgi:hypothetical protein
MAIQLTAMLLWRHASRHGLIDSSLDPRIVEGVGRRLAVNAVGFALAIPLALINPAIAYIVWILVFGLIFSTDWLSWRQALRTTTESIPLNGSSSARIRISHGLGNLHVDALEDDGALVAGVFGGGVDSSIEQADGVSDLRLGLRAVGGLLSPRFPWAWGRSPPLDWDLGLNPRVPIALTVESASGSGRLELGGVHVSELAAQVHAASMEIELPTTIGTTTVSVEANSSDVILRIPDGSAAWFRVEATASQLDVDPARFPAVVEGSEYRSAGYGRSRKRLEIRARAASGIVRVIGPDAPATLASAARSGSERKRTGATRSAAS